jgi:hypothetical protein
MRGSERPIGITTRADAKRSVGLNTLMKHLRAVSDEMNTRPAIAPCIADIPAIPGGHGEST